MCKVFLRIRRHLIYAHAIPTVPATVPQRTLTPLLPLLLLPLLPCGNVSLVAAIFSCADGRKLTNSSSASESESELVAHLLLGTIALFPLLAAAAVLGAGTFAGIGIGAARTAGLLLARRYASTELLQTLSSCRKVIIAIVELIPAGLVVTLVLPLILASGSQSFAAKMQNRN